MANPLYGCIEAGGTKFVCAIADANGGFVARTRLPTRSPEETIGAVVQWFRDREQALGRCASFGIASFGPVELDPGSAHYGSILATPKPGWSGTPLPPRFRKEFDRPVGFDTDVNAAALAEASFHPIEQQALVYVTVGTGIGGGFLWRGEPVYGLRHAEMGHIIPPRHLADTAFEGSCPFHGGCLEGLASGPAIVARWGRTLSELGADHPAQDIIAWYLGHLAATLIATFSPRNIVLGGGVMETEGLIDRLRWHAERFSAGYLLPADVIDAIVGKARLGSDVGLHGARLLAERVHRSGV